MLTTSTIYTTSDGRRFRDDEDAALAHERLLAEITSYCEAHQVPEGRARARVRNVVVGWLAWRAGQMTPEELLGDDLGDEAAE